MTDDVTEHEAPTRRDSSERQRTGSRRGSERSERTRREYMKYGGAVVGGGLLAGCAGDDGTEETEASGGTEASDEPARGEDESYTVSMRPVGDVTFAEPPTEWYAGKRDSYVDMALALGQIDGWTPSEFKGVYFYQDLGIDILERRPQSEWQTGELEYKEFFYELEPDVFLLDPVYLRSRNSGWSESDIEEIENNVAPFFGTTVDYYHSLGYEQLPSYEAFDGVAELFDERERYEAFVDVQEEMLSTIDSELPPEEERPTVGYIENRGDGVFRVFRINGIGSARKAFRDLGVVDALEELSLEGDDTSVRGETDYEVILEADSEVLIFQDAFRFGDPYISVENGEAVFDGDLFRENIIQQMEDHPVGQDVTAVQEGNVYPNGFGRERPVAVLYETDLLARQVYPEQFGSFDLDAPLTPPDGDGLFDRQRVADIINGEV